MSVEEYLATAYRPDCDYVEGVLVERTVGQKDHSKLQREVIAWFHARRRQFRLATFPGNAFASGPAVIACRMSV